MTPTPEQIARLRYLQAELTKPRGSDPSLVEHRRRVDMLDELNRWERGHFESLIQNTEKLAAVRAECERVVDDIGVMRMQQRILSIIDAGNP